MANLATITVKTNGAYADLSELADVTFTSGNKYQIQVQFQKPVYLREGSVGEGFIVPNCDPFTWECQGDTLYINADYAKVNIAE